MSWLHRLQQRLSITRNEALTLLSLTLFLLLGVSGRYICRHMQTVSPEMYAELDSLFAERASALLEPVEEADTSASSSNPPAPLVSPSPQNTPKGTELRIDLNTATAADLERLPRIGPKTAERILAFRAAFGPLRSVDDLLGVKGIGPKTLDHLRPHVYAAADTTR